MLQRLRACYGESSSVALRDAILALQQSPPHQADALGRAKQDEARKSFSKEAEVDLTKVEHLTACNFPSLQNSDYWFTRVIQADDYWQALKRKRASES